MYVVEYDALTRTEYARIFIILISGVLYPSALILPLLFNDFLRGRVEEWDKVRQTDIPFANF